MVLDVRQYILSIVSVFLALAVGIVIGTTVADNDVVVEQQHAVISRLEVEFSRLKAENHRLREQVSQVELVLESYRMFEHAAARYLVQGRLVGKRVAIVDTVGSGHRDEVAALLRDASAQVGPIIVVSASSWLDGDNLSEAARKAGMGSASGQVLAGKLSYRLGEFLGGKTDARILDALASADLLHWSGELSVPVDGVIVIGGAAGNDASGARVVDLSLLDGLRACGVNVVGAEETGAAVSCVPAYRKKGVSTVDHLDTPPGLVSVVFAIAGKAGHYGVKDQADRVFPDLGGWAGPPER